MSPNQNIPQGVGAAAAQVYPLLAVVLNYRTPELTIQCLDSLATQVHRVPGMRTIVIDNDSGDASAERIAGAIRDRGYGSWATLVSSPRNGGFAYGNNRGIEAGFEFGRPAYVLLLNSDTVLHGDVLRESLDSMEQDSGVGILSCRVLNADGSIQNVTRKFPTPLRIVVGLLGLPWKLPAVFGWANCEDPSWDRQSTARDVEWVGGAFMLIRTEVLERLGGLDEGFFFYGEDVEFCHRARKAGYRCRYEPRGAMTHLGGASSDPARLPERARSAHAWNGRYLVQRRCFGAAAARLVRALDLLTSRLRLRRLLRRGGDDPRIEQLRAAIAFLSDPANKRSQVPSREECTRLDLSGARAPDAAKSHGAAAKSAAPLIGASGVGAA